MKILLLFFLSIWSIMEVYINCCMLGKINVLGQSDYSVFKSTISLEQNDEKFLVDINSFKLKVH